MCYVPDNYDAFDAWDRERQREEERLPKCSGCGEPITDDFLFDIDDVLICEQCLNDNYKKSVEDYIE